MACKRSGVRIPVAPHSNKGSFQDGPFCCLTGFRTENGVSPARPAPSQLRQDRKVAAAGGRSGAMQVAYPFFISPASFSRRRRIPGIVVSHSIAEFTVPPTSYSSASLSPGISFLRHTLIPQYIIRRHPKRAIAKDGPQMRYHRQSYRHAPAHFR